MFIITVFCDECTYENNFVKKIVMQLPKIGTPSVCNALWNEVIRRMTEIGITPL